MLNDNSLGDRLNAVKNGKPIPTPPMQPQNVLDINQNQAKPHPPQKITWKSFLINKGIGMVDVFAASFLYGFGVKTIFGLDWSLFGAFTVGFLLNHVITIWPQVFKNIFRKK